MEKAMLSKEDKMLSGLKLSESFDIIKDYISEESRDEYKIATLIKGMDDILRGGVGPGELHCIFAPTKRGKSILLNNFAHAGVMQCKKVAFISLEMNEKQIATRTHMRLSGMSDTELSQRYGKWKRAFTRLMSRGGDIYYQQFPTKSLTIKSLDRFLDKLWKVEGFDTDLLIVDYLDIMKGDRNYDDTWKSQGPLAEGLRGLAGERNLRCWTATQAGKSSGGKDQLTERDVKGDSIKNDTFDSLWSILQKPEEAAATPPRGSIKNNLLREGHGQGKVIPIVFDKNTMLIWMA
jgi:replicative DNA helicase